MKGNERVKYQIIIEETVSETIEVEADSPQAARELAEDQYKMGIIVLEPGELLDVQFHCVEDKQF